MSSTSRKILRFDSETEMYQDCDFKCLKEGDLFIAFGSEDEYLGMYIAMCDPFLNKYNEWTIHMIDYEGMF